MNWMVQVREHEPAKQQSASGGKEKQNEIERPLD
jgi:hypothetical protein